MAELQKNNVDTLLKWQDKISVDDVTLANCDKFHDWRIEQISKGDGHRTCDLDFNTLSNALTWAQRCELIKIHPQRDHDMFPATP